MPTHEFACLSLARPEPAPAPLFRPEARQAAAEPLHGRLTLIMPPRAALVGIAAIVSLVLLGTAALIVEVPQRVRAVGVLMPAQGFLRIAAGEAAQVIAIHASEGERVRSGQPLLSLGAHRGVNASGGAAPAQLSSLQDEQRLSGTAYRERQAIQAGRIRAADDHLANLELRLRIVAAEIGAQQQRTALLEKRYARLEQLAASGNVPAMQLDDHALLILQNEAATEALKRQATQLAHERDQLSRARTGLVDEMNLQEIEFAIAGEQLQRQIRTVEETVSSMLRAPHDAAVGRIAVRPGEAVRAGQTLMTLWQAEQPLQAWLYLPSSKAGLLSAGQEVSLRLDAWPHQVFGTQAATVTAISTLALLPSELDVPLALSGPVFEVRAALDAQHVAANGRKWPLSAGASFQADIVQRRYRLYEWLLRLRRAERESGA